MPTRKKRKLLCYWLVCQKRELLQDHLPVLFQYVKFSRLNADFLMTVSNNQ